MRTGTGRLYRACAATGSERPFRFEISPGRFGVFVVQPFRLPEAGGKAPSLRQSRIRKIPICATIPSFLLSVRRFRVHLHKLAARVRRPHSSFVIRT